MAPELPVGRPLVLVTGGTSVREPDLLGGLAVSAVKEGFEVVVTVEPGTRGAGPVMADQPWNAQRVASAGAGLVIDDPAEAGPAVRTVLTEPRYHAKLHIVYPNSPAQVPHQKRRDLT